MRLRNAFKNSVFEASKLVSTKTPILQHYGTKVGQKWVFRHWLGVAQKWVQSGFRGRFFAEKGPKTHFGPTSAPLPANDEKPISDPLLCHINCFMILALKDLRPIINFVSIEYRVTGNVYITVFIVPGFNFGITIAAKIITKKPLYKNKF